MGHENFEEYKKCPWLEKILIDTGEFFIENEKMAARFFDDLALLTKEYKAYALITDTHGLYIPMKKRLFRGGYLKRPEWIRHFNPWTNKYVLVVYIGFDLCRLSIFFEKFLPFSKLADWRLLKCQKVRISNIRSHGGRNIWNGYVVLPTPKVERSILG